MVVKFTYSENVSCCCKTELVSNFSHGDKAHTRLKLNDSAVVNIGYSVGTIGINANNHRQTINMREILESREETYLLLYILFYRYIGGACSLPGNHSFRNGGIGGIYSFSVYSRS
ncbi:hypothetical protein BABINDRAFT_131837 [Babjeviella inositovora NRRL Y-12698]|uniref:Uncharacterized protein n=1 Tax=Babjeviella inositovora NRRL Y-12698 TaxID=984486 RepID=A0A1E3QRJ3_9ASCO|nr:uncharacterized protein BABINDRAFT_131837 [Babjeviella inositovora NRRL Y-12698]ODQ80323.1 hypothetical protein BABINDRAFT_131837 [Babjeviella inositovora NRRL Y-12698]